ncbi:response regulator [Actimicrobium sp. CCC2.4]|uniref:response regulator n=1 Tax=Actimicrobium sp. CCC2.4 TaxID=3048606 RepID=UPI002AC8EACE|nr:response regulator [Actimicrobium sp. CCC2.4]MEB0136481.1 response regulator [Actimicrobium sp. CCC2.4]WPX30841.1 response regulator [Actimicrobium sp. CCC2.4]
MPARILIIEDNPAGMELMSYLLQAYGHTVLLAPDGPAGVALAASALPDLIVCDVYLPGMDGYGVVRHLKAHPALADIPIIAVTALAMAGDRDKLLSAGFNGYIGKPIEPTSFISQLDVFLPIDLHALIDPTARTHGDHPDC